MTVSLGVRNEATACVKGYVQAARFKEFCDEFTRGMNRLRVGGRATFGAVEAEIKKIDRELDKLKKLILASMMTHRSVS